MERRDFLKKAGTGTAAAAGVLAAPAIAGQSRDMTIVSTWPRDFPGLGISAQRLAARITELSEGRINTTYYAAGEKVGAFDSFDDVASGNSQAYIAADYYWKGKHPGFAYFTSVPFGMTTVEWNAWIKFKGGQALWDEMSGEFGLKAIACGATGTQMGGWFNKEINSADDLKGLKMRIPGLGETYGVPVEEIQEGIKNGVRKVNIDTDLRMASTGAIRRYMHENPAVFDPRKYLKETTKAMKEICVARYEAFDTAGNGSRIKALDLEDMVKRYDSGKLDPRIQ